MDFKLLPLDGEDVEEAASEGNVWVLPPPESSASGAGAGAAGAGAAPSVQDDSAPSNGTGDSGSRSASGSGSGSGSPSAELQVDAAFMVLRRSKWLSASDRQQEVWLAGALGGGLAAVWVTCFTETTFDRNK